MTFEDEPSEPLNRQAYVEEVMVSFFRERQRFIAFLLSRYLARDLVDAEEIIDALALKLVQRLNDQSYKPTPIGRSYFFKALTNEANNIWRDYSRRQRRLKSAQADPHSLLHALSPRPPLPSQCERDVKAGVRAQIQKALSSLNESHQAMLKDYYWEGLMVAEIADKREIPVGTVASRMFRAREALKAALQSDLKDD